MKLLLLTTELHPAGAERVVFELATRLPRARFQVTVASLRSPGGADGAVAGALREAGLDVRCLRLRSKRDLAGALRLRALLRELRPDLVHAHLFHANLAARLLAPAAGALVIATCHVVERRRLPGRRWLARLTAGRDAATVCVSDAVRRYAVSREGALPRRTRVIANGIDLARFAAPADPAAARAALGLPEGALVVGAVGRLDAQKGLDLLVAAFARLAETRDDALLALAGAGPREGDLRAQVDRLGLSDRVRFLGFRSDVPEVLAALDLFCMPSRWEGFGLSLAEALAAGKPAVATAVDSLPEVLGSAGVLVPPEDPTALAEALAGLAADPARRRALTAAARRQAARFDVARMVEQYQALYEELVG